MNRPVHLSQSPATASWTQRFADVLTTSRLDALLIFWCLLAFFATPVLLLRVSPFAGRAPEALVGGAGLLLALLLLAKGRPWLKFLQRHASDLPAVGWAVLAGLLLRLAWVWIFPSNPASDGAVYFKLGQALSEGRPYQTSGTWAYWPVGYPLWLASWIRLLGAGVAVLGSQCFAYVLAALGIGRLAKHLAGEPAQRAAVWMFALWPNLWAQIGQPEKEVVIIALLPWVLLFLLDAPKWWRAALAGLALGLCILVQPGLQFLLPALALLVFIRLPLRQAWRSALLLAIGACLVVLPWTLRNLRVLGAPVLVSTNGGDNLYRANNPLATGGYTSRGEVDLSALGELDADRQGRMLAKAWIRSHPADFLALAMEKQWRFMGDDAASIYASLRVGGGANDPRVYTALKLIANVWWLAVWLSLALAAMAARGCKGPRDERWLLWAWLYLFVLHSVFESAGKYHLPMIWVLCVLSACMLTRPAQGRTA